MSHKHKKHTKREISLSEAGQILMGLAGFTQRVEKKRLERIANAFSICSNFPELFNNISLTKFVGMFLDEKEVKNDD